MYSKDIYYPPFWAENSGFMTGRDPLGLENSSFATYERLLPGMTNVTNRIRYYGFYSWLLFEYHKIEKDLDQSKLEYHFNFIRRSELIIAYLMINEFKEELSIVGSEYANKIKNTGKRDFYDISTGADMNKNTAKGSVYWDFRSGALGQYFAGALVSLNLIKIKSHFFIIQAKGKELASAFKENISDDACNLFLDVIKSGKLYKSDLSKLHDFAISNIPIYSNEWSFYESLLFLSDDGDNYIRYNNIKQTNRKETTFHFLTFLKNTRNKELSKELFVDKFKEYEYKLNLKQKQNDASFGWYYYHINEMFHYSLESIFWGLLVELDGKTFYVKDFINKISTSVVKESLKFFLTNETQLICDLINIKNMDEYSLRNDFNKLVKLTKSPSNSIKAIALSIKIIFELYIENKSNVNDIIEYEKWNILFDKKGCITMNLQSIIYKYLNTNFLIFTNEIIKHLINDHITTAFRKMGNGNSNLLKFIIEDNIISHIQTMEPSFTSPRLRTLKNFLFDLGYLDQELRLTYLGEKLLEKLKNN